MRQTRQHIPESNSLTHALSCTDSHHLIPNNIHLIPPFIFEDVSYIPLSLRCLSLNSSPACLFHPMPPPQLSQPVSLRGILRDPLTVGLYFPHLTHRFYVREIQTSYCFKFFCWWCVYPFDVVLHPSLVVDWRALKSTQKNLTRHLAFTCFSYA